MASAEIYDEEVQKAREDVKALRVQMRILKAKLASAKNYLEEISQQSTENGGNAKDVANKRAQTVAATSEVTPQGQNGVSSAPSGNTSQSAVRTSHRLHITDNSSDKKGRSSSQGPRSGTNKLLPTATVLDVENSKPDDRYNAHREYLTGRTSVQHLTTLRNRMTIYAKDLSDSLKNDEKSRDCQGGRYLIGNECVVLLDNKLWGVVLCPFCPVTVKSDRNDYMTGVRGLAQHINSLHSDKVEGDFQKFVRDNCVLEIITGVDDLKKLDAKVSIVAKVRPMRAATTSTQASGSRVAKTKDADILTAFQEGFRSSEDFWAAQGDVKDAAMFGTIQDQSTEDQELQDLSHSVRSIDIAPISRNKASAAAEMQGSSITFPGAKKSSRALTLENDRKFRPAQSPIREVIHVAAPSKPAVVNGGNAQGLGPAVTSSQKNGKTRTLMPRGKESNVNKKKRKTRQANDDEEDEEAEELSPRPQKRHGAVTSRQYQYGRSS